MDEEVASPVFEIRSLYLSRQLEAGIWGGAMAGIQLVEFVLHSGRMETATALATIGVEPMVVEGRGVVIR